METITRQEKIMSGENLTPITRKEMFLAKAAGQNIKTPKPITREEMFLSKIFGGGTSGGGGNDKPSIAAGLYETGTSATLYTWDELKQNGYLVVTDGVLSSGDNALPIGDLVISNEVSEIGECAFEGCEGLTSVTIPNSVTSIGECAFAECTGLTSIDFGDSAAEIGVEAFCACINLTSVTISDFMASIGEGAFADCYGLTSVTIPVSVTEIGNNAFSYCNSLTNVYYAGSASEWAAITIGTANDELIGATITYNYGG